MACGQGAVVTGIHCLQHIQRLATATLTDHNSVRPHPQSVYNQLANSHPTLAFSIGGTTFQGHNMGLVKL
jgi:hypothetical protein